MPSEKNYERVLNLFREAHPEPLTTEDVQEEFSWVKRTAQNYVKALHEDGSLDLEQEGKPNVWRLSENEPKKPVYDERLTKAQRWGRKASNFGEPLLLIGVGCLGAAGLITSNHIFADAAGFNIPIIGDVTTAVSATAVGLVGTLLFTIAFIALTIAYAGPKLVEWYIDDPLPDDP